MAMKRNGKSPVSSDSDEKVVFFNDEARNPVKKTLIGLEMLLIDEHGTVVQGFIPPGQIKKYLPDMKRGSVYKLINFYGSKNKPVYRVADHVATVSFTWNCELIVLHDIPIHFDEDRFRFHSYEDFEANCDLRGDLYGKFFNLTSNIFVKLLYVLMWTLTERPTLDELEIATTQHVLVHVQSHDGHVMKLYLWDQAATEFCQKFKTFENTPTVILVTTVNPKRLGGTLALISMSSTRVFMDNDFQPTIKYFTWLGCNPDTAKQVSAEVVTKRETLSIADIFSYIKQDSAKDAFFECTATIDDVVHGSAWYYIACSGCQSKATKGPTSMVCTNTKCENVNTTGVARYRAKISVYDNSEQAVFVLLGDAGRSLTGKHASELLSSYFEANGDKGAEAEVPVPEALISIIGQTHRFCVKVTDHNFSGNTRPITVTKVLSQDIPPHTEALVGNNNAAASKETMLTRDEVSEPSKSRGDCANEESKRGYDTADPEKAKRPRCEN
uniref:Replication factor A C-terminal domain-containing protein n=1 Tax=Brassica oleracea var. oleracea TaxID=109376 RepID=A0A0D3DFW7_BRAOL